jgi:sugar porter (SP) family MFS transporter
VGLVIQASSFSLGQLITGRILTGIGNGGVNAIVPIWQSECSKPKSRGKYVAVIAIFIAGGIAGGGWVNVGFSFVKHKEIAWRFPLALPLLFTIMLMAFCFTFPESPRWLVSKNRHAEARQALIEFAGEGANVEAIDMEVTIISNVSEQESASHVRGFRDFFKRDPQRLFYRLCLAIAVNFFTQMSGPNIITYYGTTIYHESLHLPSEQAALLNAGVLTFKIVSSTIACLSIDRVGRRPLFMISGLGMSCCMAGLAVAVSIIDDSHSFHASVAATVFTFLYMVFLPLGFVGTNFLYAAEIAPQDLRVHLSAVGTATHWLFNFIIAEITPIAFATITWRYYIVYACIAFCVAPAVYFFFPETKGRSLEDMDTMFSEPKQWWRVPAFSLVMKSQVAALENQEHDKVAEVYEQVEHAANSTRED